MIYLELIKTFFIIGMFSFGGGLANMELIRSRVVADHSWLTNTEFTDIISISEMTPGPLGLNCSTFAGIHAAGIPGALVACLAILLPTFTITAMAAVFFQKFQKSKWMEHILTGVRPVCIGLIAGVIVSFCQTNYILDSRLSFQALFIGVVDLVLLFKWKVSIPKVILLSAALGLVLFR